MSTIQICDAYLNASYPAGEILRQAQIHKCRPAEIISILTAAGMELPEGMKKEKAPARRQPSRRKRIKKTASL